MSTKKTAKIGKRMKYFMYGILPVAAIFLVLVLHHIGFFDVPDCENIGRAVCTNHEQDYVKISFTSERVVCKDEVGEAFKYDIICE
jgi:hypothetical protein